MKQHKVYSVIGVGIGPFNLGLAALLEPIKDEVSALFFDQKEQFDWHPGLLFDHVTLQTPFLCDGVSMADPTSAFSFLNFLKKTGRIYKFFIRENFFVLRKEYNRYCQWVVSQLENCKFSSRVDEILYKEGLYEVHVHQVKKNRKKVYYCKKLVLGTGTTPALPECVDVEQLEKVCHTSDYLYRKEDILKHKSVTVIGSGQSAAEVFYDLLLNRPKELKLNWFSRPDHFYAMEYSKLTLELTSPDYVDYFYKMPSHRRRKLLERQKSQFKGINYDLINDIYDYLYALSIDNDDVGVIIRPNTKLEAISIGDNNEYKLDLKQVDQQHNYVKNTEFVVLGTGYQYKEPDFLKGIKDRICRNSEGAYDVKRNYSIDINENEIFVQNAEVHTHSFIATDLGMGAYRNSYIINALTKREVYKIEKRIAFQDFDSTSIEVIKADNILG